MREVAGELGTHLKSIGRALGLDLQQRGNLIRISGAPEAGPAVETAASLLEQLYALVQSGQSLSPADVQQAMQILQHDSSARLQHYFGDALLVGVEGKVITPRSSGQRRYAAALRTHDVVFGVGAAGSGKTYLAMAFAVAALKRGDVKRIVLTRPAVEAGEKLGFLPGDLQEKVDPYLRPLYDALADMVPADRVQRWLERRIIEVAPLAFMRGRTLDQAYILLDEAQNTTREQMRMFLTRLGQGSKMVLTGDDSQIDLPRRSDSGLLQALRVVEGVRGISVVRLEVGDVVRHPVVARIIGAYQREDRRREEEAADGP